MSKDTEEERISAIKNLIGAWPDFPKNGILFRDVFGLMMNPKVFADCIALMSQYIQKAHGTVDAIVGLEARGFIFGTLIAQHLGTAFVPIRKAGKLPGPTIKVEYSLEYGKDVFEVQKGAVKPGQKVIIVDDLIATGGTMQAAYKLMSSMQAQVLEGMVLIELSDLKGREQVECKLKAFISYEGE